MIIYIVFFDEQGKNLLFLITLMKKMTEEATKNDNEFDTIPKLMLYHARERGNRPANRQKELGIWKS